MDFKWWCWDFYEAFEILLNTFCIMLAPWPYLNQGVECDDLKCKCNFYSLWHKVTIYVIVILEAYCWIGSPFLYFLNSGSTQLFWPRLLSKVKASHQLFSFSLNCSVWLQTNSGNLLYLIFPFYSLASVLSAELNWTVWTH